MCRGWPHSSEAIEGKWGWGQSPRPPQYGNSGKRFTEDTSEKKMGYKGVVEWGGGPVPRSSVYWDMKKSLSSLSPVASLCWLLDGDILGDLGVKIHSNCHAGPHPLSRGFSGRQVCWRQTRRNRKRLAWSSFHFCQVPPELVPHFQATKYPKLSRNSPALFLWPHIKTSAHLCPTSASVPHPKIFCLSQTYVHIGNGKNGIKPLLRITTNFMPEK